MAVLRIRKILCNILSICIVLGIIVMPSASADGKPGYLVKGEVSGGSFKVEVYLQNTHSYGGRFALAYDKNVLEIADDSALDKAVKQASGVTVTNEGHDDSVLLGNGYAMFAWYSTRITGLNATTGDKLIATLTFNFKEGQSEADFSRNTLGLYYVNETMVDGWDSSSEIISNENDALVAYRNTAVDERFIAGLVFDYYNCDYVPIITHRVRMNVRNSAGQPLSASAMLGGIESTTDTDGYADFDMQSETYFYRVSTDGYEIKSGYYIVGEEDSVFNVTLRSYSEIALDIANSIDIGYAEGDSSKSVTTDIILPTENEYGTITWASDNQAVSEYGAVKRGEDDIPVRLTATVNVNGSLATKSFDVIVKSRLTAEQKNKEVVSQDKANLEIVYAPGDYDENVTTNLTLPECGSAGSIISWSSNNESVISSVGVVKRQQYDMWVTLTADIIRGTVYETKTFSVLVKGTGKATEVENTEDPEDNDEIPENSPAPINVEVPIEGAEALIQRIVDTLEIGYANGDSEKSVTMKLTLPTVGTEGIPINWTSSLPAVVTPYGGVVRQVEDTNVTLTATVSYGDISLEKVFTVTVKAADEIPQNPNNGQEEEIAVKNHRSSSGRTSTSESGNSGSGGGGTTGAVTVPTATAEPSTISDNANNEKKQRFIDIDDVPWAQNAINTLADDGVISGTSANTYSPHLSIRRADFVMLLVKLYKLDTEITETFEDVTEDKYYYSDVSKAKSLGIISGIDETHFKPEDSISRQDMMIMTYRALMKLNKVEEVDEADITTFKDYKNISDYALAGVKYLVSAGVVHGDTDFNINPKANTTRAETAVFLFGLVK